MITPAQENLILSCFAPGARIVGAEPMQEMRPCPLRVTVCDSRRDDNRLVVLRLSRNQGGVEREAAILPLLHNLGLPVPRVLAGPACDTNGGSFSVLELLPGFTLQVLADTSDSGATTAKILLIESIVRLFASTAAVSESSVSPQLPRHSLYEAWTEQRDASGTWGNVRWYQDSLLRLEPLCLAAASTPLVFSNGDYQPGNFLTDGEMLTGFLDFEKAGFEDPLWTLARYPIYNLEPFNSNDFPQSILHRLGFTDRQFAVRVALFGLRTLRTKTSPDGIRNGMLKSRVQKLTDDSLRRAEG